MNQKETIQQFEGCTVRTAWDGDQEKWYFSLVDVVAALTDSKNPTDYLKKLRKREPEIAQGWGQIVTPLTVLSPGGPQKTNYIDREGISLIIEYISSPKAKRFQEWLKQYEAASEQFDSYEQLADIQGEVVLYQPDETTKMEVRLEGETVWLTQAQIMELFQSSKANISEHIANIYEQGELVYEATVRKFRTVQKEGNKLVNRTLVHYNLDVVISVGFRVNAKRGIRFRQWANAVIKNYLLRGYAINQQLLHVEQRLDARLDAQQKQIQKIESTLADHKEKIDFFVRTNQPPVEGVLYEGQIFDAYKLVEALVKSAQKEIILIDNYIDASIFDILEKREQGVEATIYTGRVGQPLLHLQQLNQQQYGRRIEIKEYNNRFHDRFLILDDVLYHFGASFKDLGKRLFAFERMGIDKGVILGQL